MQVRSKGQRLEREQEGQRKKTITVQKNTGISQIIKEKKSEEVDNMIDINNYKTDLGYYSIPKEIWNTLNNQDKNKIKEINMALRKKRKTMDQNNNQRNVHSISTRRNAHSTTQIEDNKCEEPENERQRVVHFEEEESKETDIDQNEGKDTQEICNRRGILCFNLKQNNPT